MNVTIDTDQYLTFLALYNKAQLQSWSQQGNDLLITHNLFILDKSHLEPSFLTRLATINQLRVGEKEIVVNLV